MKLHEKTHVHIFTDKSHSMLQLNHENYTVFIVRAVALTGRIEVFEFTSESAAGSKVRELKDEGGYIITQNQYTPIPV